MRLEPSHTHAPAPLADGVRSAVAPMRVSLLDGSELLSTGFRTMLAPHGDRVRVVEQPTPTGPLAPCDLLLVDFALLTPADVDDLLHRADGPVRRIVSFSWTHRKPGGPWFATAAGRISGHVPKTLPAEELLGQLEHVHAGKADPRPRTRPDGSRPAAAGLTPREQDIVSRIAQGMSNAEIAQELFLSINSVKTYVRTAYRKIGVTTRAQAVAWWFAGDAPAEERAARHEDEGDHDQRTVPAPAAPAAQGALHRRDQAALASARGVSHLHPGADRLVARSR